MLMLMLMLMLCYVNPYAMHTLILYKPLFYPFLFEGALLTLLTYQPDPLRKFNVFIKNNRNFWGFLLAWTVRIL